MAPKIKLRDKEINKLSSALQLPIETIQKFNLLKLIDVTEARNLLILSDWRKLKRNRKYTTGQIVEALMNEYNVSNSKVTSIIYAKRSTEKHCAVCDKRITKGEHLRNDGKCDKCVVKSIEL